jgi:hypothetical protein
MPGPDGILKNVPGPYLTRRGRGGTVIKVGRAVNIPRNLDIFSGYIRESVPPPPGGQCIASARVVDGVYLNSPIDKSNSVSGATNEVWI